MSVRHISDWATCGSQRIARVRLQDRERRQVLTYGCRAVHVGTTACTRYAHAYSLQLYALCIEMSGFILSVGVLGHRLQGPRLLLPAQLCRQLVLNSPK